MFWKTKFINFLFKEVERLMDEKIVLRNKLFEIESQQLDMLLILKEIDNCIKEYKTISCGENLNKDISEQRIDELANSLRKMLNDR